MRRALPVIAVAMVVALAACGGGSSKHKASNGSGGPQTFTVSVDGKNTAAGQNETFIAFFPKNVQTHAGDTVEFHYRGVGEPHTVTLGSSVNTLLTKYEALTPQQQQGPPPKDIQALDQSIPSLFPQGPGDANQVVANPCYIASGAIPAKGGCPSSTPIDYTGTQSLVNSGWFDTDAKWDLKLGAAIAPGTYRYMCSLHREGMVGHITVVAKGVTVPSPDAQAATGQQEQQAIETKLARPAQALLTGGLPVPGVKLPAGPAGNVNVLAGSGALDVQNAQVDEFGPKTITVHKGGSITWYFLGDHTVGISVPQSAKGARQAGPNGTAHLNLGGLGPHGGPGEPQPTNQSGGGNGPPTFKVVANATWNGQGYFSTGVFINSFPPNFEGYRVTFTQTGTYSYICQIHDKMKGTIDVI